MLTYNRENLVSRAIESVLNQTHRNFEFIIVDNGSTDKSGQIADVDVDEEDDAPSFQTYTFDFMDLCEEEQIEDKLANYIRQHKATFLN